LIPPTLNQDKKKLANRAKNSSLRKSGEQKERWFKCIKKTWGGESLRGVELKIQARRGSKKHTCRVFLWGKSKRWRKK